MLIAGNGCPRSVSPQDTEQDQGAGQNLSTGDLSVLSFTPEVRSRQVPVAQIELHTTEFTRTPFGDRVISYSVEIQATFYRTVTDTSERAEVSFPVKLKGKPIAGANVDIYAAYLSPEAVITQAIKSNPSAVILQTKEQAKEIGLIADRIGLQRVYVPPKLLAEIKKESRDPELFHTLPAEIVTQLSQHLKSALKSEKYAAAKAEPVKAETAKELTEPLTHPMQVVEAPPVAQGPATISTEMREAIKELKRQQILLAKITESLRQDAMEFKSDQTIAVRQEVLDMQEVLSPLIKRILASRIDQIHSGDEEALNTLAKTSKNTLGKASARKIRATYLNAA